MSETTASLLIVYPSFLRNLEANLSLVLPSLYEGFGMTVIEAMASRCPAVISHGGSLPELGEDAVLYVDPKDASSIREAVSSVVYDDVLREELAGKGGECAKKCTWFRTAQETAGFYEKIARSAIGGQS